VHDLEVHDLEVHDLEVHDLEVHDLEVHDLEVRFKVLTKKFTEPQTLRPLLPFNSQFSLYYINPYDYTITQQTKCSQI
jgi:hypothetical protein